MQIKAIGTIIGNAGDGRTIKVDWEQKALPKDEWYFYTDQPMIWKVTAENWKKSALIDFSINNTPQDIDRFRNHGYWKDRFGDRDKSELAFEWTAFYEAVAEKLLRYKDNRKELIDYVLKLAQKFSLSYVQGKDLQDICPFTVLGLFNRNIKNDNRHKIAQELADFLQVTIPAPSSFEGIPILNNQKSWFFAFEEERELHDIDELWAIFELAQNVADDISDEEGPSELRKKLIKQYNVVSSQNQIGWNLSMGLHWIRPWNYPTLDGQSRTYITDQLQLKVGKSSSKRYATGEEYFSLLDTLETLFQSDDFPVYSFPDLALKAYDCNTESNIKPEIDDENGVDSQEILSSDNIRNVILYGPPGTGKTYKVQNIAKEYVDNEFNEESYLANIVKNLSWLEVVIFAVLDIGKPCKLADILKNRFHRAKLGDRKVNNAAHIDQVLVTRSITNPTNLDRDETIYPRREPLIFDRNHDNEWFIVEEEKENIVEEIQEYQSILQLMQNPTSIMNKERQKRYEIVTFHQSFSYEDFVEGIRAFTSDDNQIQYSVVPGVFKEICDLARKTPEKRFAIFIDEINRGNIANIFGELISLIEPDKRQGCINELSVTLPYSKSIFSVPENLDIYGTMNTSDHSLTKLDLALRRRFEFEELLPNYGLLEDIKVHNVNIGEMLKIMNARIEVLLGRDYLIGHSYFLPLKDMDPKEQKEALAKIFQNKIIPLLQEYFFEDWERIQWVLNDHNKVPEYQFIQLLDQIKNDDLAELDLAQLFKNVRDIQHISDRRYQINHKTFGQMEAYSKIIAE
ncbi:MAG TPA: AAA family ATPase [Candidatus Ignatzschineria merdigallinarum]|uniref:AAA family ATPase n=1 Tax=Candidatus Ignatzschineria merdigallinarum TaxID=2838621 RepID=A0A9D1Q4W7_9GAMM|nr:AAA family ATPase [Candidatus Ignatzschineria merdigallinarum]